MKTSTEKIFGDLILQWFDILKKRPEWPLLESYLLNGNPHGGFILMSFWSHEYEAKFWEIEGLTTFITSTISSSSEQMMKVLEKPSSALKPETNEDQILRQSLELWVITLLKDLQRWQEHVKQQRTNCVDISTSLKESLHLRSPVSGEVVHTHSLEHVQIESRFFFGVCPVKLLFDDKEQEVTLKACAGCNSICYSDKESQKVDWKRHKSLCKAFQPMVKKMPGYHPLHKAPGKKSLLPYLEATLNRRLSQYEQDVLTYPRLCNVCLDGNQSKLKNCQECHCVAYCCVEHREEDQEDHGKSCYLLKTSLCDYVSARKNGHPITKGWLPRPQALSLDLPANIQVFFRNELENSGCCNHLKDQEAAAVFDSEVRQLSFDYTCQLTALYGASKAMMPGLIQREKLVLHVVGARQAETLDLTRWEIFFHRLAKLRQLIVVFIGPELQSPYPMTDFECCSQHLKWSRENDGCMARYLFIADSYQNFMEEGKKYDPAIMRPDLVLALNCGFIFYKEWDDSMPALIKYPNVPLVFTEYYHEDCKLDLQKLDSIVDDELDVVVRPSPNPFCSALPARIPTGFAFRNFNRRNVVMSNDYICVVRSQPA